MHRTATGLLAAVLFAALLIPPWRVDWTSDSKTVSPSMRDATWAGFHSWAFAKERPTTVIAWDGPNTGGHVPLTGTPRVAYDVWAGVLLCSIAGLFIVARYPRPTLRPPSVGSVQQL
jgi:hypothetical protein